MKAQLHLSLRDWGDGSGELCANVRVDAFRGDGGASFDLSALCEQARLFSTFPILVGQTVEISGGYLDRNDPSRLVQEHLYIGVSPINSRGGLTMRVRLAKPYDEPNKTGIRCSVSVEMNVQYEQLAKFAGELSALARGEIETVVLQETE